MKKVLVIGCGLSGAVVAREIAENYDDVKIDIWERRNHIAGNMYDYKDSHGILIHKYGPHTFHTKKKDLYDYMCRYGKWEAYKLSCRAEINGIQTPSPFNFKTIDDFFEVDEANKIKDAFKVNYPDREFVTVVDALNSDNEYIKMYAQFLFDNDYKLYTAKQWGCLPESIDPSVLARVPLRLSYLDGYFDDPYQVMPVTTYVDFFDNLINHPSIDCVLGKDALESICIVDDSIIADGNLIDLVVFTGALDELFGCEYGKLPYRSLRFEWKYDDIDSFQEAPVVAYPQEKGYTRITEYKKLPYQDVNGTTYAVEYSVPYQNGEEMEPYYPVLNDASQMLYKKYAARADVIQNLVYCGRLGNFKYYNMDQALEAALDVVHSEKVLSILT